jgi:AraC-like DNA-binding protein
VATSELSGVTIWGEPSVRDAHELVATLEAEIDIRDRPADNVADFRSATQIDGAAFQCLHDFVVRNAGYLAKAHRREAVVHPPGYVGCVVAGFFDVTPAPYESAAFSDMDRALAWLGQARALDVVTAVAEEARRFAASPSLLHRVRQLLDRSPSIALGEAAAALDVAPRTLQHQLKRANTTFRSEQTSARLSVAQHRLASTEASVSAIGMDVGCSSPQHFSDWFRAATGCSPSTWRRRHAKSA